MSNAHEPIDNIGEELNYTLYHAETDLDYDGYFCIEDVQLNSDFTGDNNDYAMLSEDAPLLKSGRKTKETCLWVLT